ERSRGPECRHEGAPKERNYQRDEYESTRRLPILESSREAALAFERGKCEYTSLEFEPRAEDETMNRADVTELHYITAIANVTSILEHGILSHTLAAELAHDSVAMSEIQAIRQNKQIPGARRLHEYTNLYFDAHNAMLS